MGGSQLDISSIVETVAGVFNAVVFLAIAVVGMVAWVRRRDAASAWFAAMFLAIGSTVAIGLFVGDAEPPGSAWSRLSIALLAFVPFALYEFMRSFSRGARWFDLVAVAFTVGTVAWSLVVDLPPDGEEFTGGALAFLVVFLVHWVALSAATAWYFLREARRSKGVAARRMRLFAGATIILAAALLLAGLATGEDGSVTAQVLAVAIQLTAVVSAVLFFLALAPPRSMRMAWRAKELETMQGGLRTIMQGETVDEVRDLTMRACLRLTGGSGVTLLDAGRQPVAWKGLEESEARALADGSDLSLPVRRRDQQVLAVDRVIVACGPAAPFFGTEERQLLDTIGAFSTLAEEQARTLERERDANERLRQVDQLKTEFVAMVAHDLRSPMSVITGFADTIHDRWDVLADEQKLEYLRLISRNTRSLAEFVEDVLQVARMESGELHYEVEPFDARAVVERIVTDMRVAHPELQLTMDAPTSLPFAMGDAERNWQILSNLVSNAMKFSNGTPEIEVELTTTDDESSVAIAVRDHGIGIASEDLPRLFRRFSRVGPSRRTVAGTGLGLYIVKSMVEAQGGRIWVDSTPGQGSTFTYTLPIAGGESVA